MHDSRASIVRPHAVALASDPSDVAALTALAKLGPRAVDAVPVIIRAFDAVAEPRFRARCFDALAAILDDEEGDQPRAVVEFLARGLDDPAFARMQGKIARSLRKIGVEGRWAIPALARLNRKRNRGAVRVPVRGALLRLAWCCWMNPSPDVQRGVWLALPGFSRGYQLWLLEEVLMPDTGGAAIRDEVAAEIARLRSAGPRDT